VQQQLICWGGELEGRGELRRAGPLLYHHYRCSWGVNLGSIIPTSIGALKPFLKYKFYFFTNEGWE
jgi:hypothetical protein